MSRYYVVFFHRDYSVCPCLSVSVSLLKKKIEYMRNHYLTHKKNNFLGFYEVVWKLRIPKTNHNI